MLLSRTRTKVVLTTAHLRLGGDAAQGTRTLGFVLEAFLALTIRASFDVQDLVNVELNGSRIALAFCMMIWLSSREMRTVSPSDRLRAFAISTGVLTCDCRRASSELS